MKKIISILLLVIYTAVLCGVTVNMHYCGGRLASYNLSLSDSHPKCPCGSKSMKKDCCKNKTIHLQCKSEQKIQNFILINNNPVKHNPLHFFIVPGIPISDFYQIKKRDVAHPPPLLVNSNPTYLLNRVFRI